MWALIGGIVVVVLGIIGILPCNWGGYFLKGLMAVLPIFALIGGAVAIASGVSDIKDKIAEKKEKIKEPEKKEEVKEEIKEEKKEEESK